MDGNCYRGKTSDKQRRIFVPAVASSVGWWESNGSDHLSAIPKRVHAFIDTGATHSCITLKLVKMLGITPKGKRPFASVDGVSEKNIYKIDMRILTPQTKEFLNINMVEFISSDKTDILLGMDIIMQGSLEVKGNTFTFCL